MSAEPSTIAAVRRRGFLVAVFALAACDADPIPIVRDPAAEGGGESMKLAPTNMPGGGGAAIADRDTNSLGPNDKVRIIVFGQPTLTGEYSLDGNGVLAF